MNQPNKLDCSITLSWKGLPVINTLTYWASSWVTKEMKCFEYGPDHFGGNPADADVEVIRVFSRQVYENTLAQEPCRCCPVIRAQKWCGEMHRQENKSHSTERKEFETQPWSFISHLIAVVFVPFTWSVWNTQVSFSPTAAYNPRYCLNLSNDPSLTLLICSSLSLSPSLSVYSLLHFHLSPFEINTPAILKTVSLNKLDWTNMVFHTGKAFQLQTQ